MMDELELLKKDWQKKEEHLPKLSYDDIYPMIWKKSSSMVKWIFYISIIEFVFWAAINFISSDPQYMQDLKAMHIYNIMMVLNFVNYGIILYFIFKFYLNYKKISVTDSSRKLMKTILKVKRTVTQYVWFNLIIFATYMIISLYGVLIYSEEGKEIVETATRQGNEVTFWFLVIAVSILFTGVLLVVIWLFYKLLYGILLKRLKENYRELKKLEV
ncbi:hypothetical protein CLV81_3896 [Flagellimonas meridianipacifica]|uniref:Uncharacterized protein n=2 Tax=Flagellimonas meridianipacifica TaxID=1080225 RepID=A0A2T0MDD8_9FLAO|nr:hypothetical protein [Allomuricauda pacifica]PRX55483.1 hypothetical protein CLV81_3896 [Allomuricauda pacifica]